MSFFRSLFILFVCTNPIIAQTYGDIQGSIVHDQTGEPISFAQIVLIEANKGTAADVAGIFNLDGVEPGNYTLMVSHIGFLPHKTVIQIAADQVQTLELKLKEQPIHLDKILVSASIPAAMRSEIHSQALGEKAPRDVGDFFKSIAGGAAVKKGGYAQDPSLRGFQRDQLNIQFDGGIKIWGGCPNRMDPPTSHIQAEDLDQIEVIKGPFSVRWGQTLGGIINLVMKRPTFNDAFTIRGDANLGYETNGDNLRYRVSLNGGTKRWDFYAGGGVKQFHDYSTGVDSVIIPSAYKIKDYSTKLAYNFSEDSRMQLNIRQARVSDVDFPALPMDAREDASDIYSIGYTHRNISPLLSSIHTKVYLSDVKHIMDNFNRSNSAMVEAVTDATTRTVGGRLEFGLHPVLGQNLYLGVDYYDHNKQGYRERFVKINPCNTSMHPNMTFVDSVWQNASIVDMGSFAELQHRITSRISYSLGMRVDNVTARLGDPAKKFIQAYGQDKRWEETNYSGMAVIKYSPNEALGVTMAAGRGNRSADITERFINHLPVGASPHEHFGNPNLNAEINNQFELGVSSIENDHQIRGSIFVSQLENYIFARVDSSMDRVFLPCNEPKVSKVFQNLDKAQQLGFEITAQGNIVPGLKYNLAMAYTHGVNLDTETPLPEVPPFETVLRMRYTLPNLPLWLQSEARFVKNQDRVSVEFGENETDGFQIFNIQSGFNIENRISLRLTVNNLMDTAYHEHLSRNFAKNTAESGLPIYEPGRNVILNVSYSL